MGTITPLSCCIIYFYLLNQAWSNSIRASSSNYPDFYYGDIITVTCDLGPLENPNALALFGLMRNGSGEVIGCSVTLSPSGNSYNPHQANKLGPSAEQCIEFFTALLADTAASLDLMFEVSQPISYQCLKWDYGDADYSFLEGKLTISKFLTAPTSLNMMVTLDNSSANEPNGVLEAYDGTRVSVTCVSVGGVPAADLEYDHNGVLFTKEFAVVTTEDWIDVSCRDKAHPNLEGGDSELTYQQRRINVYYFEAAPNSDEGAMILDYPRAHKLDCPINYHLREGATIQYMWTRNGTDVTVDREKNYLIVRGSSAVLESTVVYECTALVINQNRFDHTIKQMYTITWTGGTTLNNPSINLIIITSCLPLYIFITID